jgi:hypothetical protein
MTMMARKLHHYSGRQESGEHDLVCGNFHYGVIDNIHNLEPASNLFHHHMPYAIGAVIDG